MNTSIQAMHRTTCTDLVAGFLIMQYFTRLSCQQLYTILRGCKFFIIIFLRAPVQP